MGRDHMQVDALSRTGQRFSQMVCLEPWLRTPLGLPGWLQKRKSYRYQDKKCLLLKNQQ
jgi:hypothetical protein